METNDNQKSAKAIIAATLILALGVILGAFGAHGLKAKLDPDALQTFEIGVRYQMYHGLAILILAFMSRGRYDFSMPIWLFAGGILLFSGSLYLLATQDLHGISSQIAGPMTPIGGIFFIIGWLWTALVVRKSLKSHS